MKIKIFIASIIRMVIAYSCLHLLVENFSHSNYDIENGDLLNNIRISMNYVL